ncbi:GyrI-like domain-containing protein [Zhihengliuella halotolerans]|uniref:GyrI-like domain-containing protein n=1 Tax=Zhihengliuella halotolerans TaxID=370736 RepID=UPI0011AF5CC2|nr:GyrI-like domain-containing protein [Zhihengliuella halotolerans]
MSDEPRIHTNPPLTILGRHIRTDGKRAAEDIPALWREVIDSKHMTSIPGRKSADLYAVYTNLENSGINNEGWFSFVIGVSVDPDSPAPPGWGLFSIPSSRRAAFDAPENDSTRIVEAWQQAWAFDDAAKTFICEYEVYTEDGESSVNLGLREPRNGEGSCH